MYVDFGRSYSTLVKHGTPANSRLYKHDKFEVNARPTGLFDETVARVTRTEHTEEENSLTGID